MGRIMGGIDGMRDGHDNLVDELRKHNRPLPTPDLLLTDSYEALMQDVVDT